MPATVGHRTQLAAINAGTWGATFPRTSFVLIRPLGSSVNRVKFGAHCDAPLTLSNRDPAALVLRRRARAPQATTAFASRWTDARGVQSPATSYKESGRRCLPQWRTTCRQRPPAGDNPGLAAHDPVADLFTYSPSGNGLPTRSRRGSRIPMSTPSGDCIRFRCSAIIRTFLTRRPPPEDHFRRIRKHCFNLRQRSPNAESGSASTAAIAP